MTSPAITWQRLRSGDPSPYDHVPAALFRCADACLSTETVFGRTTPPLIEISTWGLGFDAGVLASVEYAVDTIGVPLVIVLGHDDCPAMRATLKAWDSVELPCGAMRSTVEQALMAIVRRATPTHSVESLTAAHVVETGLGLMHRSPRLSQLVDDRKYGIVCATYCANDGQLHVHGTIGAVDDHSTSLLERV